MIHSLTLVILAPFAVNAVAADVPQTAPAEPAGMMRIFNGNDLSGWDGTIVLIPLFDGTCRSVPSGGALADCSNPGNGNNLYYHIP